MRIYVINLDRSPDRLEFIQQQLASSGLTFERVPAVDGRLLSAGAYPDAVISPPEIGCFLSHISAWERAVASTDEFSLILEDDGHLSPDLPQLLSETNWIPPDADIVKLDTMSKRIGLGRAAWAAPKGRQVRRLYSIHTGSAGYIISRDVARSAIKAATPASLPVDHFLFGRDAIRRLAVYQLVPAAVMQHHRLVRDGAVLFAPSLINEEREDTLEQRRKTKTRPPFPKLILREAIRPLRRQYDKIRVLPVARFSTVSFR